MNIKMILGLAAWLAAVGSFAQNPAQPINHGAIAEALTPSMVRVQYELQPDKGDPPQGGGLLEKCPNCGRNHVDRAAEFMQQERPLEMAGYVLKPDQVITANVQIHPRFIKQITVRFQDQVVTAQPAAYARQHDAWRLQLQSPLKGAKPLAFQADRQGPFVHAHYAAANGEWTLTLQPLASAVVARELDRPFIALPAGGLVVDTSGNPVGLSLEGELPLDGSWKGSPENWPWFSSAEMSKLLATLETAADQGLPRVELDFRSPKRSGRNVNRFEPELDDPRGKGNDRNTVGVLLAENKILVLASLKPRQTARLQGILVHPPVGEPVKAVFAASLKDYGCFLATLEKPLAGALPLSRTPLLEQRRACLLLAELAVRGEKRVAYYEPGRIERFETGAHQRIYPALREGCAPAFLFDAAGQLVALPVVKRDKLSGDRNYYSSENPVITPLSYLTEALANLAKSSDPANVPLSEADEKRLAWLGIELQALTPELARANGVSDQTRDGETGALVTYVHANSPAAQAGIETGAVLLRLRVAGQAAPIEVKVEDDRMYERDFPWERLSEVPEQYFDQLPSPWPAAETAFARLLTDLGMGTKYSAEFFVAGKVVSKDFVVAAGPAHYESADRFKVEALGLTARDLTYEVRRYLQRKADEPGVVVSKVEPGSKASVSGIRPYELITHVNDQPVANVADFKKLATQAGDLRLAVKRMAKGRIVTLREDAGGKAQPAPKPESQ